MDTGGEVRQPGTRQGGEGRLRGAGGRQITTKGGQGKVEYSGCLIYFDRMGSDP